MTAVEQICYDLAHDLLDDIRRLDIQLKGVTQTDLGGCGRIVDDGHRVFGVGPMTAVILIGNTGDLRRFRNRDHFAAYTGTAPVEFSSGGRITHRLSRRRNRTLNSAIHVAAVTLRRKHSDGRAYFDRRLAEGKTKREALRSLKRHVSNAVCRQLLADANRLGR